MVECRYDCQLVYKAMTIKAITFRGSGLPSATGTSGQPAISHYPFEHQKQLSIMNMFQKKITKQHIINQMKKYQKQSIPGGNFC